MRGRLRFWLLLLAELRRGESGRHTTVDCGAMHVEIEERFCLLTDFASHIPLQLRACYWVIQHSRAI